MPHRPLLPALLALTALLVGARADAIKARPRPRYWVRITGVEAPREVPPRLTERARAVLADAIGAHPEFASLPSGAPDPEAEAAAFQGWLRKSGLRYYAMVVKVTKFEHELRPPAPGRPGQLLHVHVDLSLLGTSIPTSVLALSGTGGATVDAEVGKELRDADDIDAIDAALREAIDHAIAEALKSLATAGKPHK